MYNLECIVVGQEVGILPSPLQQGHRWRAGRRGRRLAEDGANETGNKAAPRALMDVKMRVMGRANMTSTVR